MSDVNAARRKSLVDANTNEEEIIMPGHMKKAKPKAKRKAAIKKDAMSKMITAKGKMSPGAKKKPNGKNGLTAKQKTLPAFLQKKIRQAKKRGK